MTRLKKKKNLFLVDTNLRQNAHACILLYIDFPTFIFISDW